MITFVDYSECGVRSKIRRPRIVGGIPSVHGMWPWQAGVYRLEQTTGEYIRSPGRSHYTNY